MTKLWLDDMRPHPEGWERAKSVKQAIELMEKGDVTHASLDHDLGYWSSEGGNGIKLTDWMAEHDCWPTEGIRVHSSNPSGVQAMLATIDRYGPYGTGIGWDPQRGTAPNADGSWPPSDRYM